MGGGIDIALDLEHVLVGDCGWFIGSLIAFQSLGVKLIKHIDLDEETQLSTHLAHQVLLHKLLGLRRACC